MSKHSLTRPTGAMVFSPAFWHDISIVTIAGKDRIGWWLWSAELFFCGCLVSGYNESMFPSASPGTVVASHKPAAMSGSFRVLHALTFSRDVVVCSNNWQIRRNGCATRLNHASTYLTEQLQCSRMAEPLHRRTQYLACFISAKQYIIMLRSGSICILYVLSMRRSS